jgi:cytochrome c5
MTLIRWSALALVFLVPDLLASERLEDGKRSYEAICASCHESGADGAPVVGRAEDWEGRSDLWEGVLFEHAEAGYIKMPARGAASHATNYDVEVAAEYMLHITYPDRPTD